MKKLGMMTALSAFVAAMGLSTGAAAQSTWNLSAAGCTVVGSGTSTSAGCAQGVTTATVTGWANTGAGGMYARATVTDQGTSGIGMLSGAETGSVPDHAIDSNGNQELVLLNFGTDKVSLSQVRTGWSQNDTDIAVLRWTGATGPNLSTMTTSGGTDGLIAKGWQLVASGDLDGVAANTNTVYGQGTLNIGAGTSSSWWIISSYFSGNAALDAGNDYFKLLSFTGTCTGGAGAGGACGPAGPGGQTPEPASLALVGIALAGVFGVRRAKKRR
jgi:hypothetical protein